VDAAQLEEAWTLMSHHRDYNDDTIAETVARWVRQACNEQQIERFLAVPFPDTNQRMQILKQSLECHNN